MRKYIKILIMTIVGLLTTGLPAFSQEGSSATETEQRSRITYVNGDVVIQPSTSGNTLDAVMNMPLMTGDRLACGTDGAVEFRLGDGLNGWLWYETKIEFVDSTETDPMTRNSEIRLWYGAIALRTMALATRHTVSVDLGSGVIRLGDDTLARVTVESDQTAVYLTVTKGTVSADTTGGILTIAEGETWRTLPGSGEWTSVKTPAEDTFDAWFVERDQLLSGAYTYSDQFTSEAVPPEYVDEAASLHGYGRWVNLGGSWYWSPYVASGWVPYHHGYWDYYPVWGWTWVPFEPWGWTVYHFGYWAFYYDWGWLWFPSWRWRGHYAHWRTNGRTVHWVAAHPEDDMDAHGLLRDGAIPRNSQLAIGIPVEAGETVDQMLTRTPIIRNAIQSDPSDTSPWMGRLPDTLKPSGSRRPGSDRGINEAPSRIQRYGQPPVHGSTAIPNRDSMGNRSVRPYYPDSGSIQQNRRQIDRGGFPQNQNPQPDRVSPNPPSRQPFSYQRIPQQPSSPREPYGYPTIRHPSPAVNPPKPQGRPSVKKPPVKIPVIPDGQDLKKSGTPAIKGSSILNLIGKGLAGKAVKGGAKALAESGDASRLLRAH
ncbi:hypothetical protein JW823_01355 [bacterium]|nr:hypothetical protein [candidate division CSSED10-310 bacterium]